MQRMIAAFAAAYGPTGRKWTITQQPGHLLAEDARTLRAITLDIRPDNAVVIGMRNDALAATYRVPGPVVSEHEQNRAFAIADLFMAQRVERTTPALADTPVNGSPTSTSAVAKNRPVAWKWA